MCLTLELGEESHWTPMFKQESVTSVSVLHGLRSTGLEDASAREGEVGMDGGRLGPQLPCLPGTVPSTDALGTCQAQRLHHAKSWER